MTGKIPIGILNGRVKTAGRKKARPTEEKCIPSSCYGYLLSNAETGILAEGDGSLKQSGFVWLARRRRQFTPWGWHSGKKRSRKSRNMPKVL
jgi:hypothetical protein